MLCCVMLSSISVWLHHGLLVAVQVLQHGQSVSVCPVTQFPFADVGPRQKPASSPHGETLTGNEVEGMEMRPGHRVP